MGRNFFSVCNKCKVQLMHLRGKEGDNMQRFANDHVTHKEYTEVYDDYVNEPPEEYKDTFDEYNPNFEKQIQLADKKRKVK